MYYVERNTITTANFLAGSVAEPSASETVWVSGGTYAVGDERIRPDLHRVFKCAAIRSPATTPPSTTPPESDPTGWVDMRPTDRWLPFGPLPRADGKLVYQSLGLESTSADIEYRLQMRYANAIALFGLRGAAWSVDVYAAVGDTTPVQQRSGSIKAPAAGYYDYAYGQRRIRDRVLITDLPMYPSAEVRVKVTGGSGQLRRLSQCEVGKLRFLPGVDFGGTEYGLERTPKVYTTRKDEANGSASILIYGTSYDMSGTVSLSGNQEDSALSQLRGLIGRGVAYAPTLSPGYEQSLVFGVLKSAPTSRMSFGHSQTRFDIEGLPTDVT